MTPAERDRRLLSVAVHLDEMAAAFMRLDREVRELLRAEFHEPDAAEIALEGDQACVSTNRRTS
ncbi:hypothetical protein [Paracoccus sanguinis]|uniref:PhoU domain-containing protein n=1 Tax=Paracoccus sanguinis TaxID=1545044 RepID=A0A099GL26_9RHOB|nr:hypothetical protein [Paracoccus sanguinis]KGJ23252.1 hypothetical protein IX56_03035 [Paracoccus sanguinis]